MPTRDRAPRWSLLLPLAGATAVALHGAAQALALRRALRRGRRLAAAARAFQHRPEESRARVLLIGDSTGVGVGAARPEDSLPGRLAQRYPAACIVNRCRTGARVGDLRAQFDAAPPPPGGWDLVLVLAGGNDVLHLTPLDALERDADALLRTVAPQARRIAWMGSANVGSAPVLRAPLAWWASRRTRHTMRRLARVAGAHGVPFIDFWRPRSRDPFGRHAGRWFAADGLHPSAASYRHCFAVLDRRVRLASLLAPREAHFLHGDTR
jgi:lysophospholipase L1-like esterase